MGGVYDEKGGFIIKWVEFKIKWGFKIKRTWIMAGRMGVLARVMGFLMRLVGFVIEWVCD